MLDGRNGDRSAIMDHKEESHWKLSLVSMQHNAADVDDDNLGVVLEATVHIFLVKTCLSQEMYHVCNVATG